MKKFETTEDWRILLLVHAFFTETKRVPLGRKETDDLWYIDQDILKEAQTN